VKRKHRPPLPPRIYRLNVTANHGADVTQISELALLTDQAPPE
jgi:hypothetical protein